MATSYLEQLYQAFGKLFVRTINGQKPNEVGDVSVKIDTSNLVAKTGNRGQLSGYETAQEMGGDYYEEPLVINESSPDSMTSGSHLSVNIENGQKGTAWTKVCYFYEQGVDYVTLGSDWYWPNNEEPTLDEGAGLLVCCWCGVYGIVNYISDGQTTMLGGGTFE